MKYRELPIDDSKGVDQFKVNDHVRVFRDRGQVDGRVLPNDMDNHEPELVRFIRPGREAEYAHWKACRKLQEVKPRGFLWCFSCDDVFGVTRNCTSTNCDVSQMREVIEE